jgi:hypothetical protein
LAYWPSAARLDAVDVDDEVLAAAPRVTPVAAARKMQMARSTTGQRRAGWATGSGQAGGAGGGGGHASDVLRGGGSGCGSTSA